MAEAAPSAPEPEKSAEPENEVHLSFMEHLADLRKRLVWAVLGVGVGMLATGFFAETIFRYVMRPALAALPEGQRQLNYTSYLEPFIVYLKVALYGGLFVAAPWVLWQLWLFIAPGLYKREKRTVVPFLVAGTLCFYAGALFCYYAVMPYAFPALVAIAGDDMRPLITMREQLSLALGMLLGFGIVFEVPVILGFLSLVGLVSADFLKKYRRHAIVFNTLVAAIITPTGDPFNLAMMAVPMILFYEIGIILAKILGKKGASRFDVKPEAGAAA